jgi:hypothetical protein
MKRILCGLLLLLGLTFLGFVLALLVASELVYPGGRELDRGLARLSFAMYGAFAGFVAATLLGLLLKPPQVIRIGFAALLLACLTLGFIAWRAASLGPVPALLFHQVHAVGSSPCLLPSDWSQAAPAALRHAH